MISIVMPVYNGENYLKKSIESILNQTCQEWELILVDNGSEDDSFRICQEYAERDQRIEIVHLQCNQGVSVARNSGMEKVTGEYVTFLDADDWIVPDYLEQLVKRAKSTEADLLVCQFQKVYDKQRYEDGSLKKDEEKRSFEEKVYSREEYIRDCLLNGCTHCWGVLYKSSLVEGIRFPAKITI